jgi:3',5'-cyclic AMP phosphodiesterase CpdA
MTRIAVISDLHIGSSARAKDFSLDEHENAVIDDYIGIFRHAFENDNHRCDALLVAGDITNRARADEFALAATRIKDIAEILGVPENMIFFTPGNHDSNWALGETREQQGVKCPDKIRLARYELLNSEPFFKSRMDAGHTGSFDEPPFSILWTTDNLAVLSYNSSAEDSLKEKLHNGKINHHIIEELRKLLDKHSSRIKDKIKVLLVHHHPINYVDRTFPKADHSIMENGDGLLELAAEFCFDFIVHGHKHVPRYKHIITEAQYPINVLCSGSFSSRMDDRYFHGLGNSFHVIEIDGTCSSSMVPQGRILNWSHFASHGWIPNNPLRESIPHQENFGSSLNRNVIKHRLESIIKDELDNKGFLEWPEVERIEPKITYCSTTVLSLVLEELSGSIGFTIHRNQHVILIKNREAL